MNKILKIAICVVIAIVSFIVITVIGFCLGSQSNNDLTWVGDGWLMDWQNWKHVSFLGSLLITLIVWFLLNKKLKVAICLISAGLSFNVIALIIYCLYVKKIPLPFIAFDDLDAWKSWFFISGMGALLITLIVWLLCELPNYFKQKTSNT